MQNTACKDEQMPDRMHVACFAAEEQQACSVSDAARQQKNGTPKSQRTYNGQKHDERTPSHADIADHGEDAVALEIDGI